MSAELALFWAFGGVAVFGAVALVGFVRQPLAGVLSLVATMVALSGIQVLLGAHFLGAVQLLVYAGAILVLFLFVIMLLDVRDDGFAPAPPWRPVVKGLGAAAAAGIAALLVRSAWPRLPLAVEATVPPDGFGGFRDVGLQLFTRYAVPFELVGLLLLAAIVGAVILARPGSA